MQYLRRISALLSLLLFFAVPSQAAPSCRSRQALAQAAEESHIPAVACAVVNADEILYEEIFGTGAGPDTPFLLGSLSKSFTALGILQLSEQGRISLDAPLSQYLPDAQADITIRQLLNQTGGIGTYQTLEDYRPRYTAGRHMYSNTNYALLGKVTEAVTGMPYAEYLRENILTPLGMSHTSADASDALAAQLVQGHINLFGIPVPADAQFPDADDWIQPAAGYIFSSLRDMARYLQMYLRGGEGLVSSSGLQMMLNDGIWVEDDIPYIYAMGWTRIEAPLPAPVYRHSGLTETGMSCMYLLPEQGLGVIFLASGNDYLVGTDLMDRLGWNFILELMDTTPGTIAAGEYVKAHLLWDGIYAAVLAAASVPLCCLFRTARRPDRCRSVKRRWALLVGSFAGAAVLPMVPFLFLKTPLWVVGAFVPDLYAVLLTASALLAAAGILQAVQLKTAAGCPQ